MENIKFDDVKNIENVDPEVINFNTSNLSRSFIESLEFYNFKNGEKIGEIERLFIGDLIAVQPISVFDALKMQGLYFNPEMVPES